jgi:hypothetical protein
MSQLASESTVKVCNSLRPSTLDALSELRAWRELRKSQIIGSAQRALVIISIVTAVAVSSHLLLTEMSAAGNNSATIIEGR